MTNNNVNINTANGGNSGNNVMASHNSCSSDGGLASSIVGGHLGIGSMANNNETSPKSSSNQQHHHHSSSATAFSAAAGFWSAAYQGKPNNRHFLFFVACVILILYSFLFVCQSFHVFVCNVRYDMYNLLINFICLL